MCSLSYSQKYSISRNELIGKWHSRDEYKRLNDSVFTTNRFDIEFLSTNSLRFILPESNPFSKAIYLYEIDTINHFLIIKYHLAEVSTIYKIILIALNHDTISLFEVAPENIDNPLKALYDEKKSFTLIRSKNN